MDNKEKNDIKEKEEKKPKFNFKNYIDSNPAFKKRHMDYVGTKVECSCGRHVTRGNLSKHKTTSIHKNGLKIAEKEVKDKDDDKEQLNKILVEIAELKKILNEKKV